MVKIGIIGGSGLDNPGLLNDYKEVSVKTPYGSPSSKLVCGKINNVDVVILSRHGKDHTIMPTNVNSQANIFALKKLGCTHIIATTACGSLNKKIKPGTLVLPNQFIDRTTKRKQTFFEKGKVCHISMEEPFCRALRLLIGQTIKELKLDYQTDKTVVTIEGPRFSSRAESLMNQKFGGDIVNMSTVPEVVLAREAGLCYQAIAMVTDYDCFMEHKENVSWEQIFNTMKKNADNVKNILVKVIEKINYDHCICRDSLKSALV
ncbi:MAG: S-methyl-5'-thioadenosine phosphorylase [Candidatus Nanoarchaeia archaeon]|nr:S-methyl-5'-thioadenosine phosphorylase [Candidatus Nanoarchaeia archaeon]MDD5587589.1 S-methyl-5'-thioadenosine phosphorylase [Candidatus Nanoarchaeia archaeon]